MEVWLPAKRLEQNDQFDMFFAYIPAAFTTGIPVFRNAFSGRSDRQRRGFFEKEIAAFPETAYFCLNFPWCFTGNSLLLHC